MACASGCSDFTSTAPTRPSNASAAASGVAAEIDDATIHDHVGDARLAFGERAGFVEGHDLDRGRAFEMDAAFEQHAAPRRPADRREDGGRRADDERARRSDDHDRHGAVERRLERLVQKQHRDDDQPEREEDHARRVELLGTIEEALRVGLLRLRLLDHAHEFFDGGILREFA